MYKGICVYIPLGGSKKAHNCAHKTSKMWVNPWPRKKTWVFALQPREGPHKRKESLVILLMVQKSCTSWYGDYPSIERVSDMSGGCLGLLNHQQYHMRTSSVENTWRFKVCLLFCSFSGIEEKTSCIQHEAKQQTTIGVVFLLPFFFGKAFEIQPFRLKQKQQEWPTDLHLANSRATKMILLG